MSELFILTCFFKVNLKSQCYIFRIVKEPWFMLPHRTANLRSTKIQQLYKNNRRHPKNKQRNRQTNKRAASDGTNPATREKSPSKTWLCPRWRWRTFSGRATVCLLPPHSQLQSGVAETGQGGQQGPAVCPSALGPQLWSRAAIDYNGVTKVLIAWIKVSYRRG